MLDEHLTPATLRSIKARQHQMQVDAQRVHGDDFARQGACQTRQPWCELLVIGDPRPLGAEMRVHGERRPRVELLPNNMRNFLRLQAERMSAQIYAATAVCAAREMKCFPKGSERILAVQLLSVAAIQGGSHRRVSGLRIGRLGAASATDGGTCRFSR